MRSKWICLMFSRADCQAADRSRHALLHYSWVLCGIAWNRHVCSALSVTFVAVASRADRVSVPPEAKLSAALPLDRASSLR